ncbi:Dolichyl-diphosphooligosaccharide--protein glycosyltransferase subunit 3 [Leucoagaricus sp. SymC.cos]|nr:Dolichyl-diphosphooligosaccharide--protein glycosyltransferase subunit 3 [Leucoagaricus sp. SymC.cos]
MKALLALLAAPLVFAATPYEKLLKLSKDGNGVIKLDPKSYDLLTSPRRTWSASVQLTALDKRRKCSPCREFDPAWNAIAKAWTSVPQEQRDNHFFATLDFDDGPTVFQKLGLSSAPVVFAFAPTEGNRASRQTVPDKYDFSDGFEAGPLAEFLSRHTPTKIPYHDPIDWTRVLLTTIFGLSILLSIRFASPILQIRNMPYVGGGGWIAAGFQSQYGQEVHVVAFIYGLLSFAFLMLVLVVPSQSSPNRQRAQIYLWSAVIIIIYSVLVSLFRVKNRGYPFKLFL